MLDFAEELTGTPSERIKIKSESNKRGEKMSASETENALSKFFKLIKTYNSVIVG